MVLIELRPKSIRRIEAKNAFQLPTWETDSYDRLIWLWGERFCERHFLFPHPGIASNAEAKIWLCGRVIRVEKLLKMGVTCFPDFFPPL